MLGSLILYLKGMRIMMFQLSGFYYRVSCRVIQGQRCSRGSAPRVSGLRCSPISGRQHGSFRKLGVPLRVP